MTIRKLITSSRLGLRRLSVQLALLFIALFTASMVIFTYYAADQESERITRSMIRQADVLAINLASTSANYLLNRDYTSIEYLLLQTARFRGILAIQIYDTNGRILGDVVRQSGKEPEARYGQPPITPPFGNTRKIVTGDDTMIVWQPLILGDLLGWAKITYGLQEIETAKAEQWKNNTINGAIIIIIAVLLLFLIMRRPLASIAAYTEFADGLDGSHGEQAPVNTSAVELERLGKSLNQASSRLHFQNQEITRAIDELERLAAFPEKSPNFVFSMNEDGDIAYLNPCIRKFLRDIELTPEGIMSIIPRSKNELVEKCIRNQEALREIEYSYDNHTLLWSFAPVVGQNILHGYGIDISERKNAERKAHQALIDKIRAEDASDAKSRFLANVSHELRTPLNAIIGYSEILEEDAESEGQMQTAADLQKVHSAAKHLLNLINEVLDLSKIEAGKMEIYPESFDVRPLVEEVIATIESTARKNNNEIVLLCPNDAGVMKSDMVKLRQTLFNLLSNATKFTENGTVQLSVSIEEAEEVDWITFSVSDTGIGMSKEQLAKLFVPFAQADVSTTRKYGGTGLGLTICNHFVEMLGGNLKVESTLGQGSTFTLRLPVTVDTGSDLLNELSKQIDNSRKLRIPDEGMNQERREHISTLLVIDDDPVILDLMMRYMNKEGIKVEIAANGTEGLEMARKLQPDIITLDVMMPGKNGWAILTAIKDDPELSNIPVIMISSVGNKMLSTGLGAVDYLSKPVDWKRLDGIVKKWLRNKELYKQPTADHGDSIH